MEAYTCSLIGWERRVHPQGGHLYRCFGNANICGQFPTTKGGPTLFSGRRNLGPKHTYEMDYIFGLKIGSSH